MQISQIHNNYNSSLINRNKTSNSSLFVNFTGVPVETKSSLFKPAKNFFKPVSKKYDRFTTFLAKWMAKALENKTMFRLIEKTKNSKRLVPHLCAVTSVVLSGFYIKKTLSNEKLDANKKRTLAINQATVWGVSTILGYTFNDMADKQIKKFKANFERINKSEISKQKLNKLMLGIDVAKSVMIFDIVYRYLAPVLVTPIANKIGNHIQEKKEAELAQAQKIAPKS